MNQKRKIFLIYFVSIIGILAIVFFIPHKALADQSLSQQLNPTSGNTFIATGWKYILALLNIVVVLGLIFIAFANILRINVETYQIKRMLPAIIIGVILANFSYLICRIFVDAAQVTAAFLIGGITPAQILNCFGLGGIAGQSGNLNNFLNAFLSGGGALNLGVLLVLFLLIFILILPPTLLMLGLGILLAVRIYLIWILVILAPIAFFGLSFPPLGKVWQMWWSWWVKWLLLAPLSFLFIRLAVVVTAPTVSQPATAGWFARWFFGIVLFGLAIYMPYVVGGKIVSVWSNLWKSAAGYGVKGFNAGRSAIGGSMQNKWKDPSRWQNKLGKGLMFSPSVAIADRMKQSQNDIGIATRTGPLGFLSGKRGETEMWIASSGKMENKSAFDAIGLAGGDQELINFYRKRNRPGNNGKYQPRFQNEYDASVALSQLKKEAATDRPAAERLKTIMDTAGIDASAGDAFRDEREIFTHAGIFAEKVPGGGTPQVPNGTPPPTPTPTPPPPTPFAGGGPAAPIAGVAGPGTHTAPTGGAGPTAGTASGGPGSGGGPAPFAAPVVAQRQALAPEQSTHLAKTDMQTLGKTIANQIRNTKTVEPKLDLQLNGLLNKHFNQLAPNQKTEIVNNTHTEIEKLVKSNPDNATAEKITQIISQPIKKVRMAVPAKNLTQPKPIPPKQIAVIRPTPSPATPINPIAPPQIKEQPTPQPKPITPQMPQQNPNVNKSQEK
jgi:hypothetical protein